MWRGHGGEERRRRRKRGGEKWEFSICEGEKEKMREKIRMGFFLGVKGG